MEDDVKTATLNQPESDEDRLESVLKCMLTDDSKLRRTAEDEFKKISPDQKAFLLLRFSKHSEASEELRSLSLDLLSRLLKDILHTWSSDNLAPFSGELIESLLSVTTDKLRDKMGDILVQVADHSIELNSGVFAYPSIAAFIQTSAENKCNALKRTALSVIRRVPKMFGIKRLSDLRGYIQKSLADSDISIRFSAVQTFFSLIKNDTFSSLSPLLPSVIQICEEYVVAKGDSNSGYCPISCLLKLATQHAIPMRVHLDTVIHICSKVSSETSECIRADLQLLLRTLLKGHTGEFHHVYFVYTDEYTAILTQFVLNHVPPIYSAVKEAHLNTIKMIPFKPDFFPALLDIFTRRFYDHDHSVRAVALFSFMSNIEYFAEDDTSSDRKFITTHARLIPRLIEMCEEQLVFHEEKYFTGNTPVDVLVLFPSDFLVPHSRSIVDLCDKIIVDFNRLRRMDNPILTESELTDRTNTITNLTTLLNITKGSFSSCDSKSVAHFCRQLTFATYSETVASLRTSCLDLICTIFNAAEHIDESWSVIQFYIHDGNYGNDRKMTLDLIRLIPQVVKSEDEFTVLCVRGLIESSLIEENMGIRMAAWEAYSRYSYHVKNEEMIKKLGTIIPIAMKLTQNDYTRYGRDRESFLDICCPNPKLVQPYLRTVVNYYCEVIKDRVGPVQPDGEMTEMLHSRQLRVREMALRAVSRLSQNMSVTDIIVNSSPSLVPDIVSSCLQTMSELDEYENWAARWFMADEIVDHRWSGQIIEQAGETAFAEIVNGFCRPHSHDVFLPFMLPITEKMLTHVNWTQRNAGLMGLSFVARAFTEKNILDTIKSILPLLKDPVFRVRSSVCFTLGRIAAGCAPTLLELFHAIRVSAEAAVALARFCNAAPQSILSIHISILMRTTVGVLESTYLALLAEGKIGILTQASNTCTLKLLVSMKKMARVHYVYYYDRLILPLKHLVKDPARDRPLPEMYALTIECISLVGTAVGKKKFEADATEVMRTIMPRFESLLITYPDVAPSFALIASPMGDSFFDVHPTVMTTVLNAIRAPIDPDQGKILYNVHFVGPRKRGACKMAVALANKLGESFTRYVGQLTELALSYLYLDIFYNDRVWAAEIFAALISVVKGNEELRNKLWNEYWKGLREVMMSEEEERSLREKEIFIRSIALCIEYLEGVPHSEHAEIDEIVIKEEKSQEMRRIKREDRRKMWIKFKMDHEVFDLLNEEEKVEKEIDESLASITMALKRYYFPHPFSFLTRHNWF